MLVFRATKATLVQSPTQMLPASTIVTIVGKEDGEYVCKSLHTGHTYYIDCNKFDDRFVRMN